MSKNIDFENLLQPVGSLTERYKNEGNIRLAERNIALSENNPVLALLRGTEHTSVDDMADLYDQAYQWEIDNANWLNQLRVDEAIKHEQREYDSYESQMARARDAGINLDLQSGNIGSGGSGSSGTSSGAKGEFNPLIGNTPTHSSTYVTMQAIATAGQLLESLGSSVNSISQGISSLRNSASMKRVSDSQAHLYSMQADEIDALLDGKVERQNLGNIQGFIVNSDQFSRILGKDFTDEQSAAVYAAAGIPEDHYGAYNDVVRSIQSRPEFERYWSDSKVGARWSKEQEKVYDEEYVANMVEQSAEIQQDSMINQGLISQMSLKLNQILSSDEDFIQEQAGSILGETTLNKDRVEQAYKEFSNYCLSYGERIDHSQKKLRRIDSELDEYKIDGRDKDGNIVRVFRPDLTPAERAYCDALLDSRMLIKYGAANDMMLFTNAINEFNLQAYIKGEMVREDGSLKTLNGRAKISQFGEGMFRRGITGVQSGLDIANNAIGTVGSVITGLLFGGAAIKGAFKAVNTVSLTGGAAVQKMAQDMTYDYNSSQLNNLFKSSY